MTRRAARMEESGRQTARWSRGGEGEVAVSFDVGAVGLKRRGGGGPWSCVRGAMEDCRGALVVVVLVVDVAVVGLTEGEKARAGHRAGLAGKVNGGLGLDADQTDVSVRCGCGA